MMLGTVKSPGEDSLHPGLTEELYLFAQGQAEEGKTLAIGESTLPSP